MKALFITHSFIGLCRLDSKRPDKFQTFFFLQVSLCSIVLVYVRKRSDAILVLDEDKLTFIFSELSKGFDRSPFEIAATLFVVAGFIAFFVVFASRQVKRRREETEKRERQVLARLVRTKRLLPAEITLLNGLKRQLKKGQRLFDLFESAPVFNGCVKRYRETESVSSSVLSSLRVKLGFRADDPDRIPHSTAELAPGTLLVMIDGKRRLSGTVKKIDEGFFLVSVGEVARLPAPGTRLTILLQKKSGLYKFKTVAGRSEGGIIRLRHAEEIQRVQRRRYYRRHISLPVMVRRAEGSQPWVRTSLKDLGGGGASIAASFEGIEVGEELEVSFNLQKGPPIQVRGIVVRCSKNGRLLHVQFGPMNDAQRDRIIAHLFQGRM
jgi:c-di-GMP-binding flagellar brake protein YcgR